MYNSFRSHFRYRWKTKYKRLINYSLHINKWLLIIFSAIFFMPAYYAVPKRVYTLWQATIALVSLFYIIRYFCKNSISLQWIFCILFFSYYFVFSTIVKTGTIISSGLFSLIKCVGFVTMFEYETRYNFKVFIRCFIIGSIVMCSVHFITFLLYNDVIGGMNPGISYEGSISNQHWYFLTHSNGSIFYFLPVTGILWFSSFEINKQYKYIAYIFNALAIIMYAHEKSVTALFSSAIILLFVILYKFRIVEKCANFFLDMKKANFVGIAICILMIILNIAGEISGIFLFFGKTNEDARATFWINSLNYFFHNKLFGVGYEDTLTSVMHIGKNHCHNIIIQILYSTGIIGIILFLFILFFSEPPKSARKCNGIIVLYITVIAFWIASSYDWYLYMPIPFAVMILIRNFYNVEA